MGELNGTMESLAKNIEDDVHSIENRVLENKRIFSTNFETKKEESKRPENTAEKCIGMSNNKLKLENTAEKRKEIFDNKLINGLIVAAGLCWSLLVMKSL